MSCALTASKVMKVIALKGQIESETCTSFQIGQAILVETYCPGIMRSSRGVIPFQRARTPSSLAIRTHA